MKKLFYTLVCALLLAAITVTAVAAGSAEMMIDASQTTVCRGDTVSFTVKLSEVEDCRSAGVVLTYDKAVFEFVSGKCSLSETALADFSDGSGVFAFGSSTAVSGEIFSFQLKVKNDAAAGEYSVSANGNTRTSAGAIPTTVNGLTITVSGENTVQTEQTESVVTREEETEAEATETGTEETTVPARETENPAPEKKPESANDPAPAQNAFPWWLLLAGGAVAVGGIVFAVLKKNNNETSS